MATSNVTGLAGGAGAAGTLGRPNGGAGQDGGAAVGLVDYGATYGPFDPVTASEAVFTLGANGGKGGAGGAGYSDLLGSNDGAGGAGGAGGISQAHLTDVQFSGDLAADATGQVLLSATANGGGGGGGGANGLTGLSTLVGGGGGGGGAAIALLDDINFLVTGRGSFTLQATSSGGQGGDVSTVSGQPGNSGDGGGASSVIDGASLVGAVRYVTLSASAVGGRGGVSTLGLPATGGDGGDAVAAIRNSVINLSSVREVDIDLSAQGGARGLGVVNGANGAASIAFTGNEIRLGALAAAGSQLNLSVSDFRGLASLDISGNIFDGGTGVDHLNLNVGGTDAIRFDMAQNTVVNFEYLVSGGGDDMLFGDAYDNVFQTGAGDDQLNGRVGFDAALYLDGAHTDFQITRVGDASFTVRDLRAGSPDGTDTLTSIESLRFSDGIFLGNLLSGGVMAEGIAGDDKISPTSGPNAHASALDDVLYGWAGDDSLDGGAGADLMYGGSGNDTYFVDNALDTIVETASNGIELVYAAVNYTLVANLENLTLTGSALDGTGNDLGNTLTGNAAANHLFGLDGKDILNGGAGNDVLVGGAGADTLTGGAGADHFVFDMIEAGIKDTVKDFVHATDRLDFAADVFTILTAGAGGQLDASHFALGTVATTASQHLIYTASNGALYYDADGAGGAAQVQIAVLTGHPTLSASDIYLV